MKKMLSSLFVALIFFGLVPFAWSKITIYLCGDSTMQDWNTGYYPKRGIGQDFQFFWNADYVTVANKGAGGTYAMGYYTNNWPAVLSSLQSGDFVIIQFGINDRTYSNETDFVTATTAMVNETLAKGAHPIIINPVRRSDFRSSATNTTGIPDSVYESYHNYPIRAREIASSLGVPLIDMDTLSRNYLLSVGQFYTLHYVNMYLDAGEYSTYANGNSDNLHLQQNGASVFDRIMTEQMRVHSDANVKSLAQYLAPMYSLAVKVSPEDSDSATTVSTYYPAGVTVTLKTTPKAGKTFLGWYDGSGNAASCKAESSVQSAKICTFVMGNASTQYTAVYTDGSAQKYTGTGAALSTFPTGTPKVLENVSPGEAVSVDTMNYDKDIEKWFDAYAPDSGYGYSENNNAGFSGEGFWNFTNAQNSTALFDMIFPSAGYVTMGIIYANGGSADRTVNVYLDHDYLVSFPSTGSWTTWDTAYVNVDLANGEETLKFISMTAEGGPNIDAFGFSLNGVRRKAGNAADTSTTATMTPGIFRSASLEGNSLRIFRTGAVTISIFGLDGRRIAYKRMNLCEKSETVGLSSFVQATGVYRVVIKFENSTVGFKWKHIRGEE